MSPFDWWLVWLLIMSRFLVISNQTRKCWFFRACDSLISYNESIIECGGELSCNNVTFAPGVIANGSDSIEVHCYADHSVQTAYFTMHQTFLHGVHLHLKIV